MIFADLAAGSPLFLDANTLVYHFAADPVFGPSFKNSVELTVLARPEVRNDGQVINSDDY